MCWCWWLRRPQEAIPEPLYKGEKPEDFETEEEKELRLEAEAKAARDAEIVTRAPAVWPGGIEVECTGMGA